MLIRPSALGDICRTVPVLVSLRHAFPQAQIDWLVQDSFAPAVAHHPVLNSVVPFPRRQVSIDRLWRPDAARTLARFLRTLRRPEGPPYTIVFDCQGLGRSGLFALATGAPRRVGYANARELGWAGCTERYAIDENLHTVDRMLALLERAGVPPVRDMRLYTSPEARRDADDLLSVGLDRDTPSAPPGPLIIVAPTSRWPGKRWPAERYLRLVRALLDETPHARVAIVGGRDERDQCAPLIDLAASHPRAIDLIGRTSISALMALVERAALVIANDSAAVHMAVGFDRPLLGLYGPTRVDLVGPYGRARDVIQAVDPGPRNRHKDDDAGAAAMRAILVETVIERALERLRTAPAA